MLHLILGPDHKVNTDAVLSRILSKAGEKQNNLFLIVPEQFSFEMERILCKKGGETVSRYAEVLSLSRLADRVESIYGGVSIPWLDKGGRLLAAAQAVEQVRSRLKLFASVSQKPEFLETLLSAIDEFGSYDVTVEMLKHTSEKFSGQFALKLQELALLYESYLSVCAQARDPIARLQNLRNVLSEEDFAADKEFYVCLFDDFSALEEEIINELLLSAREVTIALPEESASGAPVFSASHLAARGFRSFCSSKEIPVLQEKLDFDTKSSADVLFLQHMIAQSDFSPYTGEISNLSFSRFDTEEQECRKTAERIRTLIGRGERYRNIGVACSDFSLYEPVLSRVLDSAAIPHFAAGHDSIATLSGTKMVLAALDAISSGLELETVIDYLKTDAAPLTMDQRDRLENYAILWNISGNRWEQEWTWHPEGLDSEWKASHYDDLKQLNQWRETGLSAIFALRGKLHQAKTVSSMAEAVFAFMTDISLPDRMQKLSDRLFDLGEFERAQQYCQIYDILADALEQMSLVLPDASRSVEEFCRLFEKLVGCYTVSAVPSTLDQVLIGDIASFRGKAIDHLLILGAGEGKFPTCSVGNGVFTEEERKQLLADGFSMAPLRADVVDRELSHIYSTIRSAVKSCMISCAGDPSYLFVKAAAPFGGIVPQSADSILLNEQEQAAALLRAGRKPENETMKMLDARRNHSLGKLDAARIRGMYGDDIRLSASSIDKFTACRFAYFLRYGLRADERLPAKFDASAFGTFVHAVLEKTAQIVMENGGFRQVSDDALHEIAQNVMEEYAAKQLADLLDKNPRLHYLFRRNCHEAMAVVQDMADELRISDFSPAEFEFKFADDGQMPAIRVEGDIMTGSVKGFVDRIDLYRHGDTTYVRVVDYKTGRKDFDYTDIAVGEGMQMLIYLFAITQNGTSHFGENLQPAGVLYHMARQDAVTDQTRLSVDEVLKKQEANRVRKGLIADNDVVIHAMEHFEESPKYLPFSVKKDGRAGDLADSRQMKLLQKHVMDKLKEITDAIGSGDVNPNPIVRGSNNSACTYCEYSTVCQKDFLAHDTRYLKKISNKQFFEQLEQEVKDRG